MNIFNKVALQGLKKNRTRTLVTIIGVVLSAAMITAVATFAVSLQNYLMESAIYKYGSWHVEFLDSDSAFVQEQSADRRTADTAVFENIGYAVLEGGKNPDKPYLFIAGFDDKTFDTLPVNLVSGRLPKNSSEVLVSAHVATNGGVQISVGDTLTLDVGNRMNGSEVLCQHDPYISGDKEGTQRETFVSSTKKTYTVVGICQRPGFEEFTAPGYTLITIADEADAADSFSTFVTLKKPYQLRSYLSGMDETCAYTLNNDVLRFLGLSNDHTFNVIFYTIEGILIALIMVGSIFLIYNSFTISLNGRIHEFGIFLSVGATPKQLRSSVLFEGLCIGAVGLPVGIAAGIGSIWLLIPAVAKNFGNMTGNGVILTLSVSVPALIAAAAVSMVTILVSAYIPAKKAADTPVMECIRQTNEVKVDEKEIKISKFSQRIYGLEGILALKNFKRNRRRYRSIILSLTLSVVLFITASSFGTVLKQVGEQSIVDVDYDICFYSEDIKEEELSVLYDVLKTADGVYESSRSESELTFRSENPAQSAEQMQTMIAEAGIACQYKLYNTYEIFEENRSLLFIINLFSGVFTVMISLIATANVFNTISTNIKLRRRELAMLRSVGMPERNFNRMMRFECIFYGIRTLLFGIPISGILSWLIYKGVTVEEIDMDYAFPWSSVGISVMGVFLVIFVTMLYAVDKIKKENIIDALRDDMV